MKIQDIGPVQALRGLAFWPQKKLLFLAPEAQSLKSFFDFAGAVCTIKPCLRVCSKTKHMLYFDYIHISNFVHCSNMDIVLKHAF